MFMRMHGLYRQGGGFIQKCFAYWKIRLRGHTWSRVHQSRCGEAHEARSFRNLEVMQTVSPLSTQKVDSTRRTRTKLVAVTSVALIGLIVGGGFMVQSVMATNASIEATTELSESTGVRHEQLDVYAKIARVRADTHAETTINDANVVIAAVQGKVDATPLATSVVSLSNYKVLDMDAVVSLTDQTKAAAANAQAAAAEVDRAEAAAAANTPGGAQATARTMAASQYGWGESQFSCLVDLWNKESGWSVTAFNSNGGATGIPQALPGSKMASAGADWKTNATTQVSWGLEYISGGYGTPCSAWSHSQSMNWY